MDATNKPTRNPKSFRAIVLGICLGIMLSVCGCSTTTIAGAALLLSETNAQQGQPTPPQGPTSAPSFLEGMNLGIQVEGGKLVLNAKWILPITL